MANEAVHHDHSITICTTCRRETRADRPGADLIERLRHSRTDPTGSGLPARFSIGGVDCMAGCSRACTVAFQARGKSTYLFGGIDPSRHVDALVAFARQYEQSTDGWTRCAQRPIELADKTLARIPALHGTFGNPSHA